MGYGFGQKCPKMRKMRKKEGFSIKYLHNSEICCNFASKIERPMRTTQEYIATLKQHAPILRERFGMKSMSLFGSVARGKHTEDSDVDVFVDMPVTLRGVGGANDYLEQITGKHVDMIVKHRNLTPFFLKEVERDGVRIF